MRFFFFLQKRGRALQIPVRTAARAPWMEVRSSARARTSLEDRHAAFRPLPPSVCFLSPDSRKFRCPKDNSTELFEYHFRSAFFMDDRGGKESLTIYRFTQQRDFFFLPSFQRKLQTIRRSFATRFGMYFFTKFII